MADPLKTPISEAMLNTTIRGGKWTDPNKQIDNNQEWFGPQRPIHPSAPPDVAGRQFDYPTGYNINLRPRANEPISFEQLRALADNLDILRLVIETRKDNMASIPFEIKPKDEGKEKDARCERIEAFFAMPDQEHTWTEWLRMIMEDMDVIDALTIYPRMTKGGQLYALEPIDGATIVRKLDAGGRTPMPSDIAYQQYLKGVPAGDFTRDELIYKPRNLRTNRVYGYSPVEQIVMTINIALRRQVSQLQFYTEGSTPDLILTVPPDWTTDQVRQFDAWWNNTLSGNTAARRQTKFVHGGVNSINTKEGLLKDEYDEWLARIITYAFGMAPTPFVKQLNRATAETAVETAKQEGMVPVMVWLKNLIDYIIIKYFGYTDIEFAWQDLKDPDLAQQAQIKLLTSQSDQIDLSAGIVDINEVRLARKLEPLSDQELEARKPVTPPQLTGATDNGTEPAEDKKKPDSTIEPAAKLQKKKGTAIRSTERERASIVRLRTAMQRFLTRYLKTKGADIADQAVKRFAALQKSEADDQAEEIYASLVIEFDDIVPEMQEYLKTIAQDGVTMGAARISLTDKDATKVANERAKEWATDRAAELVGMKWVDGELVANPDSKWSISESTRDGLRTDITKAIDEAWTPQELRNSLKDNYGFSSSRAEMIARTETAFADVQGNIAAYEEAKAIGIDVKVQWITAQDADVCEDCEMNDGEIREIGEEFSSGATEPPQHPNCRCDLIPVVG